MDGTTDLFDEVQSDIATRAPFANGNYHAINSED